MSKKPKVKESTKPRTIRLGDADWKKAIQAAKDDNRTVSNWVAELIRGAAG